jgi:hypothetical protein
MKKCDWYSLSQSSRTWLAVLLLTSLTACMGGGGGDGSDSPTTGDSKPASHTDGSNATPVGSSANPAGNPDTSTNAGTGTNTASAKWTYLVYMSADNNLSSAALKDINEMEKIGSSTDVNVVVQVDFSSEYSPNVYGNHAATTARGLISKDNDPNQITSQLRSTGSNLDMGNKQTLADFIAWAKQHYPAQNYALVLWSHGAGWKISRATGGVHRGALQDETAGSFMRLPDIASAIRQSNTRFGLINFDACLMGMVEVAKHLQGSADYLVASEETEPGDGDDYEGTLRKLQAKPGMTALELSKAITESYQAFYARENRSNVTKSALDLNQYPAFDQQLQELANYLNSNLGTLRGAVQSARDDSASYQYSYNRDLGDFITQLKSKTSDTTLITKLNLLESARAKLVASNQVFIADNSKNNVRSTGVAIFLPKRDEIAASDMNYYLNAIAINGDKWGSFSDALINGTSNTGSGSGSGTGTGSGSGSGSVEADYQQTSNGNFVFYITWDNPAVDLDLYIYEPQNLVAPWMGSVSLNGFMSADSSAVGKPEEYYAAAETVEKGVYDVFVNYYEGSQATKVSLYYADPNNGETLKVVGTTTLSPNNPAPAFTWPTVDFDYDTLQSNPYSDWWFAGYDERSLRPSRARQQILRMGNKTVRLHLLQRRAIKLAQQQKRDPEVERIASQRLNLLRQGKIR